MGYTQQQDRVKKKKTSQIVWDDTLVTITWPLSFAVHRLTLQAYEGLLRGISCLGSTTV